MDALLKFIVPVILFLVTIFFGVWLSRVGKPYNGFIFNVHKLIALGAVIVVVVQFSRLLGGADALGLAIVGLAVAAICVVALFVSGALMSADKGNYALMRIIHKIVPGVVVVALALAVYELLK